MTRKNILYVTFILLLGVQSLASENLIYNGDFRIQQNGKPFEWYPMQAEANAISLEDDVNDDGRTFLKISHEKKESYSLVQQMISVQPDSTYILTGRVKTANVVVDEGGMGPRVFVGDKIGNAVAVSSAFHGTTPWRDIKVEIKTGSNKLLTVFLYLHKASGTVWFDDLKLTLKPLPGTPGYDGVPFKISGYVGTRVYHSPETGFKIDYLLRDYSTLSIGENYTASFMMYVIYSGIDFGSQHEVKVYPWINNFKLRLNGPLFPSGNPVSITLGQESINYSRYIAVLNDLGYSKIGHGLFFKDLRWNKADISGFLVWENNKPYRDIGEGLRVRVDKNRWRLDTVLIRHLNGNPTVKDGKIESLEPYKLREQDLQIQYEQQFLNGVKLNLLHVEQNIYNPESATFVKKAEITAPVKSHKLVMEYRNFDPGFDPRYRDKTPAEISPYMWHNSFNDKLADNKINPVDQYKDQQGISLILNGPFLNKRIVLELDHYTLRPEYASRRTKFDFKVEDKTFYQLIGLYDYADQPVKYLELAAKRNIFKRAQLDLSGQINYVYDRTGENNDLSIEGVIRQYELAALFKSGFLKGLSLNLGTQRTEKSYLYVKGKWSVFRRVDVLFAYRFPNCNEGKKDLWFDELNRIHYRDNFINFKSVVWF